MLVYPLYSKRGATDNFFSVFDRVYEIVLSLLKKIVKNIIILEK